MGNKRGLKRSFLRFNNQQEVMLTLSYRIKQDKADKELSLVLNKSNWR